MDALPYHLHFTADW